MEGNEDGSEEGEQGDWFRVSAGGFRTEDGELKVGDGPLSRGCNEEGQEEQERPQLERDAAAEAVVAAGAAIGEAAAAVEREGEMRHVMHVDIVFIGFIVGKQRATIAAIEKQTAVKLSVPKAAGGRGARGGSSQAAIEIRGRSMKAMEETKRRIKVIIEEAIDSPHLQYSHFLSIPLALLHPLPANVASFKSQVLSSLPSKSNPDTKLRGNARAALAGHSAISAGRGSTSSGAGATSARGVAAALAGLSEFEGWNSQGHEESEKGRGKGGRGQVEVAVQDLETGKSEKGMGNGRGAEKGEGGVESGDCEGDSEKGRDGDEGECESDEVIVFVADSGSNGNEHFVGKGGDTGKKCGGEREELREGQQGGIREAEGGSGGEGRNRSQWPFWRENPSVGGGGEVEGGASSHRKKRREEVEGLNMDRLANEVFPRHHQQQHGSHQHIHDLGIDNSIFVSPATFHVTIQMLKLWNLERLQRARDALQSCMPAVRSLVQEAGGVRVGLRGLKLMKGSPAKAHVLHLQLEDASTSNCLHSLCAIFFSAQRWLQLHATLINTSHRKKKTMQAVIPNATTCMELPSRDSST